ncbi:MAG: hypothetical protein UW92_C0018G0013 [Candidatus Jorgensenbacteria bacterium GW2011_GWA2_45_13]|uniref:Large ribosomal subunit protein bL19 n=1 Tax=Candidatus Jorgensenbacteria bacterium GW2011_GWA2_45_13 TaxID=1618662 RepID=A0A0G1L5R4_9BACT|nr:MAG: hypothetical protein UW92_C0018G0013 [Candidatus Jorgensenbacteria bacterium GW2011_GWA2_45_13]
MLEESIVKQLQPGAKVRVWERIKEGEKERQTPFEGIIITFYRSYHSSGSGRRKNIPHTISEYFAH